LVAYWYFLVEYDTALFFSVSVLAAGNESALVFFSFLSHLQMPFFFLFGLINFWQLAVADILSTGRDVKSIICETDATRRDQTYFLCGFQAALKTFSALLVCVFSSSILHYCQMGEKKSAVNILPPPPPTLSRNPVAGPPTLL
jgi:hypothetical protein